MIFVVGDAVFEVIKRLSFVTISDFLGGSIPFFFFFQTRAGQVQIFHVFGKGFLLSRESHQYIYVFSMIGKIRRGFETYFLL